MKNKRINRLLIATTACAAAALSVGIVYQPSQGALTTPQHYVVEGSESYSQIATKFNVPLDALRAANRTGSTCPSGSPGNGRIIHIPVAPFATCTTPPGGATTTTAATTTTVAATTTTTIAATTTTAASTTTTQPAAGLAFSENFASADALSRFDHDWSGEVQAGALFGSAVNDWMGDHNTSCGDPNTTMRPIHVTPPADEPGAPAGSVKDVSQVWYPCTFTGDAAKSHMMTSVNTEGYVTVWMSPKTTFTNVKKVCWSQNLTWLGGGKWTLVNFLTQAEYQGQTDLGYTSPDFPANGGASSPQGSALNGVKMFGGNMESYTNGEFRGSISGQTTSDKAARYHMCVADNGNGTLTLTSAQPSGSSISGTIPGNIPDGAIRVVFVDDSYNPDKHCGFESVCVNHDVNGASPTNSTMLYTWHWDDFEIFT